MSALRPENYPKLSRAEQDAWFQANVLANDSQAGSPRFRLYPFNEIKPDDGAQYLVKGLLPRSGLAVVWGPPKCGKSFWVFDLLMHVALDWTYRNHRVTSGPVVYCALEGALGFKNCIEAFKQKKLSEAEGGEPPFYLMPASLSLVADHQALIADIRKQLGVQRPIVVCLDTLNRSLAGSESSDADMAAYIKAADAIRDAFDCLVVIVHHCGHSGERPRGHSSLIGALDVQIAVSRDAADNIVAELELSKDGAIGLQFVSALKKVEIGVDQDGDDITSCIIEEVEGSAVSVKKTKSPSKSDQTALRALQKAINELGEKAPASNTVPASARVVSLDTWRTYAYQSGISGSDKQDSKLKAFSRAHDSLVNDGHVKAHGDLRWI